MSYKVVFRRVAKDDLEDIEEYLSQFYSGTVKRFFEDLEKKSSYVESNPYMYQEYDEDSYFRKMSVGDYLLFYHVDEDRNLVIVHRIFHNKRDIKRLMQEHSQSQDTN